jgi:glycosyltransferase involved in cell wall biosynthesis
MSYKFSIIIPTFNNADYLELCLNSILKNSFYKHQLIVHINGLDNATEILLSKKKISYTKTEINVGLCSGVNMATKIVNTDYVLYAHDDMYFLPDWDLHLFNEVREIKHNNFYLSMTHISYMNAVKNDLQHIQFDCGSTLLNFNEQKLLNSFRNFSFRNIQGSHWAPHLIHIDLWKKVGGFSEEFNPGFASDPDLNMKLWRENVRIFKGVSLSRVYHFGSITTRKNKKILPNKGKKTFLLKWKFSVEFFTKHYLRRGTVYNGPLNSPIRNLSYYIDFLISKFKYLIAKIK